MRIRKTFVMYLHPGCEDEYRRRHDQIWPEMKARLKAHGVHNYSISLCRETCQLFAYAEVEDEVQWEAIAATSECRKWWQYMCDIMKTNEDNSPRTAELYEVFYLE